jgi:hypothetical protein
MTSRSKGEFVLCRATEGPPILLAAASGWILPKCRKLRRDNGWHFSQFPSLRSPARSIQTCVNSDACSENAIRTQKSPLSSTGSLRRRRSSWNNGWRLRRQAAVAKSPVQPVKDRRHTVRFRRRSVNLVVTRRDACGYFLYSLPAAAVRCCSAATSGGLRATKSAHPATLRPSLSKP